VAALVVWVGGVRVQVEDARVVGQAVHAQATVLRCAIAGANGGGRLCWLEPMVEAVCMHVWAPCQALV
jgi:hypothetical protein